LTRAISASRICTPDMSSCARANEVINRRCCCDAECLLLAQSGHNLVHCKCPLSGVKRTCRFALQMSAFDPKRSSFTSPSPTIDRLAINWPRLVWPTRVVAQEAEASLSHCVLKSAIACPRVAGCTQPRGAINLHLMDVRYWNYDFLRARPSQWRQDRSSAVLLDTVHMRRVAEGERP
jgi:hypothetical protein